MFVNREFTRIVREEMETDEIFVCNEGEKKIEFRPGFHDKMRKEIEKAIKAAEQAEKKRIRLSHVKRASAAVFVVGLIWSWQNVMPDSNIHSSEFEIPIFEWLDDNFILKEGNFDSETNKIETIEDFTMEQIRYVPEGYSLFLDYEGEFAKFFTCRSEETIIDIKVSEVNITMQIDHEGMHEGFGYSSQGIEYNKYLMEDEEVYYIVWEQGDIVCQITGRVPIEVLIDIMEGILNEEKV